MKRDKILIGLLVGAFLLFGNSLLAGAKIEDHNATINGSGKLEGGTYNSVEIRGKGEVQGSVQAQSFRNLGNSTIAGNLKTKELNTDGSLKIEGNLEAEKIESAGSLKVSGRIKAKKMRLSGTVNADSLEGTTVEVPGGLNVAKNVNVKSIKITGVLNVGGNLNAEEISLRLDKDSKAKQIKAKKIQVSRGPVGLVSKRIFSVERIEAEEIELINTQAKLVKGKNVKIGPGCKIDTVEYRNNLEVDKDAEVTKKVKK